MMKRILSHIFVSLLLCCSVYSFHITRLLQTNLIRWNSPESIRDVELTNIKQAAVILISGGLCFFPKFAHAATSSVINVLVDYDGNPQPLKKYLGDSATLVINVASQCALTPQYGELVELYEKYHSKGFQILAFPCNQFGSQEPDPIKRIRKDVGERFGVKFPIFDKIDVNGLSEHPLYKQLKEYEGEIVGSPKVGKISWNFEKFLLDKNGVPVRRYKPGIKPSMLENDIAGLISTGTIPPVKKITLNDF